MFQSIRKKFSFSPSLVVKNSFWGLFANILQNVFSSLFFVIVARKFSSGDFAFFLIGNTLYQFVAAFSAMGLGQWFVREMIGTKNKENLVNSFMKMQLLIGLIFSALSVVIGLVIYNERVIQLLVFVFALNVIFDNVIYAIRHLHIVEATQSKTFRILLVESAIKFFLSALLYVVPFSIITFSILLVAIRFFTLGMFLRMGSSETINLRSFWKARVSFLLVRQIISKNWAFVVIGSAYIIYWRIANIIISKTLTLEDVAFYEISYKFFSLAQLIPIIVSTTVFGMFVKLYNEGDREGFQNLYRNLFKVYLLFGLLAYTFMYSFADTLLPLIFGSQYAHSSVYAKQMFLTILVYPTALLQANILVSMKMEKVDMWCNVGSMVLNVATCLVGLQFVQSLELINYSIFASFLLFHFAQDYFLIKHKISTPAEFLGFGATTVICVLSYSMLSNYMSPYTLFASYWLVIAGAVSLNIKRFKPGFNRV